jgi:hypothetical protein
MSVTLSTPKSKSGYTKYGSLARTDTTAKELFKLPKGSLITGMYVIGAAVSNAATTATIGIGSNTTANQFMTGYDVKTAATGEGYNIAGAAAVGSAMATGLTADTSVYGIYAETGTASTAGGPWTVKVEYAVVGPNETLVS